MDTSLSRTVCVVPGERKPLHFSYQGLTVVRDNTDTEGATESFRIEWVKFRENVRAFFPQGQRKLSVIKSCPCKRGVRKAGFNCI